MCSTLKQNIAKLLLPIKWYLTKAFDNGKVDSGVAQKIKRGKGEYRLPLHQIIKFTTL